MTRQLPLNLPLDPAARLEEFVGDAPKQVASLTGLIIVAGDCGTGKSHLLQGVCTAALERSQKVYYLASLERLSPEVLEGLEAAAVVCLDDVDHVLEQWPWQLALFHLVNACRDRGATLILSGLSQSSIESLSLADLASRLKAAYRIQLQQPGDDDKLEIRNDQLHRSITIPILLITNC